MSAPNMFVEPTNDLDTDMLADMEDLLDSWAGTLLVVSHDRYFLERVTDQQYAILDRGLRHLPGGVDEYLKLRAAQERVAESGAESGANGVKTADEAGAPALSGAELRAAEKELASLERRMEKLQAQAESSRNALADHDQADYQGLADKMQKINQLEEEASQLEERWFELTEQIGG